jgi:hypothetical protein
MGGVVSAVANPAAPVGVSFPESGGPLSGLGVTSRADPRTGPGSLTVPIEFRPERSRLTPDLALGHGIGTGKRAPGLGRALSVASVARKTLGGAPGHGDADPDPRQRDTFVITGEDDMIAVSPDAAGARQRYPRRTEGVVGRIERRADMKDPLSTSGRYAAGTGTGASWVASTRASHWRPGQGER